MSKETSIHEIQQTLSKEEDDIVNSILSEINDTQSDKQNPNQVPPQQMQQQEQQQMQQQQMQQQMQQQQMQQQMQQQQMQQQMQQQQMQRQMMNSQNGKDNQSDKQESSGFFESLLKNNDMKEPFIIAIIAFVLFLPQTNNMLLSTGISAFIGQDGSISMMGTAFKCLTIGIIYFTFKTFFNQNKS
jgi:hypothetical protein